MNELPVTRPIVAENCADRRAFMIAAMAAMAATGGLAASGSASAQDSSGTGGAGSQTGPLHPVRLKPEYKAGEGLEPMPPWPAHMQPRRPSRTHTFVQWYAGDKLTCMVYESDGGIVQFTNLPYDEQVVILAGKAVLTSADGRQDVFEQGDIFVAPLGWTGTWEMSEGYRELICFESQSIGDASKHWFE